MAKRIVITSDTRVVYSGEGSIQDWQTKVPKEERKRDNYDVTELSLSDSDNTSLRLTKAEFVVGGIESYHEVFARHIFSLNPSELNQFEQLLASRQRG